MFDIGFSELLLFGAIALIVLGPEKLPHAARTAGRWYAKFRRTVTKIQSEIEAELDLAETRQRMQEELDRIKLAEVEMKQEMQQLRDSFSQLQQARQQTNQSPNISLDKQNSAETSQQYSKKTLGSDENKLFFTHTEPMYYRWFLLSDYDKKRRLPNAPFLPNYQADGLLTQLSLD